MGGGRGCRKPASQSDVGTPTRGTKGHGESGPASTHGAGPTLTPKPPQHPQQHAQNPKPKNVDAGAAAESLCRAAHRACGEDIKKFFLVGSGLWLWCGPGGDLGSNLGWGGGLFFSGRSEPSGMKG
eukprot:scaffold174243_cov32-Tisochrysis_lutea.AAC.1